MQEKTPKYLESDESCVKRACKDESSAYQILYNRYKHRIYRFIWLKIEKKEDAKEITDKVFDKAFSKLSKIKEPQYFRAWLFKIAINEVKMYHRALSVRINATSVEEMPEQELAADNPGISALSQSVVWTFNELSQQEQDIINYRLIQKKEIDEIAKLLGINNDAVKYLLKKARKKFIDIYKSKYKLGPVKKAGDENEKV
jgi:RNA polymerase sigma-70 factor (ECF subfamily)